MRAENIGFVVSGEKDAAKAAEYFTVTGRAVGKGQEMAEEADKETAKETVREMDKEKDKGR